MTIQYQGVWSLQSAAQLQSTQRWVTDPLFDYTTLLLQADDAANGSQNNTFLDSSSNAFAITRNGNTTQGSFTPFSQSPGWWSNYFNSATPDWLSIANNAAFDLGTGDCTIEAWIYTNSLSGTQAIFSVFPASGTISGYTMQIYTSGFLGVDSWVSGNNQVITANNNAVTVGSWFHVAYTRSGGTNRLFVNGNLCTTSTNTLTQALNSGGNTEKIGYQGYAGFLHPFNGYISNLRVLKGTAQYTAAFTPSTTPLTNITNTSLLTCQSNRFIDNSTNAFALTANGTPSVQAFSPFAPQFQWTPSVIGGSGYFDGTADYLSVPASSQFLPGANTDFTFEAWVYLTATPSAQGATVVGTGEYGLNSDWSIAINSSRVPSFYFNVLPSGFSLTSSTAINLNSWNHIAVTRSGTGANNLKMFLNGVNVAQASRNDTMDYTGNNLSIGADENGDESVLTGYISGLRLINGTGYTSISVPTTPPTAITNTALLLNFTNAGIYDGTMKNNLETVGNAQVSTAVVKYGSGSMYFDGTGDYLSLPVQRTIELGSSDWTFETWVYMNAVSSQQSIIYLNGNTSGYAALNLQVQSGALNLWLSANGSSWSLQQNTIGTIAANAWNHIAVVKVGTNIKVYINGTNVSGNGYTVAASLMTTYTVNQIGVYNASSYNLNGYLDDMRLTLGIARYTQNFIPPSVALPRQ